MIAASVRPSGLKASALTSPPVFRRDAPTRVRLSASQSAIPSCFNPTAIRRPSGLNRPGWSSYVGSKTPSSVKVNDRTMQRRPELEAFAAEHDLVLVTIADLILYRRHREKLVRRVSEARIPTQYGDFTAHVFESLLDGRNAYLSDGVQQVLGRAPRDFTDFAREAAAAGTWKP